MALKRTFFHSVYCATLELEIFDYVGDYDYVIDRLEDTQTNHERRMYRVGEYGEVGALVSVRKVTY